MSQRFQNVPRSKRLTLNLAYFLVRIDSERVRSENRCLRFLRRGGAKADTGDYTGALYHLSKCLEVTDNPCIQVVVEIYQDACNAAIESPSDPHAFQDVLWAANLGGRVPEECRL